MKWLEIKIELAALCEAMSSEFRLSMLAITVGEFPKGWP